MPRSTFFEPGASRMPRPAVPSRLFLACVRPENAPVHYLAAGTMRIEEGISDQIGVVSAIPVDIAVAAGWNGQRSSAKCADRRPRPTARHGIHQLWRTFEIIQTPDA